jgi:hypothetical protein
MKPSAVANQRKRRALAVLKKSKPNAIPSSVRLVAFRDPTSAERGYGKTLAGRAARLLAPKPRKLAASH